MLRLWQRRQGNKKKENQIIAAAAILSFLCTQKVLIKSPIE
jgi:hypothetical protein